MAVEFIPTTFTPRETAGITGMNEPQQRNMRRAGYLQKNDQGGWMRFSVIDGLPEALILQQLANLGLPPARSQAALSPSEAGSASVILSVWAQMLPGAIEAIDLAKGERPIKVPPHWGPQFQIVASDGWSRHCVDRNEFFDDPDVPKELRATAIVLDLKLLAEVLLDRARRPLWTVVVSA